MIINTNINGATFCSFCEKKIPYQSIYHKKNLINCCKSCFKNINGFQITFRNTSWVLSRIELINFIKEIDIGTAFHEFLEQLFEMGNASISTLNGRYDFEIIPKKI
jgi:hypothetical protein